MTAPALTPTGRVILGLIAIGRQTGYDIKQLVDKSTRHFWSASYGQIYPELRRLEDQGLVRGHPDVVVEVVSPTSRRYDRMKKLQWYAQLGVPEYWLVDPEAQMLERLVLRDGVYAIVESLAGDEVFRPASFEGLEIPLARLWEA